MGTVKPSGDTVIYKDKAGNIHEALGVFDLQGMSLPAYDYISMGYTGSNLTSVVYKTGGAGGTTVATLTLGYDGNNNLTSVTRS